MTADPVSRPGSATGPHAFVADLAAPALDPDDRHHLRRVLRVRDGDAMTVSDGEGRWRSCRFGDVLEVDGEILEVAPFRPELTIGFALVKGERPEMVVQKLTELGIDRIQPFTAARSVVRWQDERAERHVSRLGRIAREASMQCRRVHLPRVLPVAVLSDLLGNGVALADQDGGPMSAGLTCVLVGPEGGWAPAERADAVAAGVGSIGLGPHVMRAETAAITAAAVLAAMRAGVVRTA